MFNTIRGFHQHACWRLADKRPKRQQNSMYWCCPADEAVRIYKLRPIQLYIAWRRHSIMTYVVKRLIYKLYMEALRSGGALTRTKFWWEKDLFHWIELAKDDCPEGRMIYDTGV